MWPNLQFPPDLVTFTQEILNGKLHFLRSDVIFLILWLNDLDQTPTKFAPGSKSTFAKADCTSVLEGGANDKCMITVTSAITLSGQFLPIKLICEGKTSKSLPRVEFPESFKCFQSLKMLTQNTAIIRKNQLNFSTKLWCLTWKVKESDWTNQVSIWAGDKWCVQGVNDKKSFWASCW